VTTSAAAIRDLCLTAIEALTPRSLSTDRFERYREDRTQETTFEQYMQSNPDQYRRFTVRDVGTRDPGLVLGGDYQEERVTFEVVVGYPISNRYGTDAGRDLDDVVEEDQRQIEWAIGPYGPVAFGTDATPLYARGTPSWDRKEMGSVLLLIGQIGFQFWRSTP